MSVNPLMETWQREAQREASRRMAVRSGGHRFITLKLLNNRFQIVSGIEIINATPYVDEMEQVEKYHLEVIGGETKFQFDPQHNCFAYDMLDSDHNRAFLASHYHTGLWEIADEKVDKEIKKMSDAIEKDTKTPKKKAPAKKSEKPVLTEESAPQSDLVDFKGPQKRIGVASP